MIVTSKITTKKSPKPGLFYFYFLSKFFVNFNLNVFKDDNTRIILINNSKIQIPKYIEQINFVNFDEND